jgi:hypothetical protein
MHPQDHVCGQSRQYRATQFARNTVRTQQPTGKFGFIHSFEPVQLNAVIRIDVAQCRVIIDETRRSRIFDDFEPRPTLRAASRITGVLAPASATHFPEFSCLGHDFARI